jgi:hypothetical protein
LPTHHHPLVHVAVVQDGLDHVVAVAVPEELLEAGPVEHLADENLADFRVGNADAFLHDVGREPGGGVSELITGTAVWPLTSGH